MSIIITNETNPLRLDGNDVVRVGNTRVTLHTVVNAFNRGATAEEIVLSYPALKLDDVYLVIGYYLRHKLEIDEYLSQLEKEAEELRQKIEAQTDMKGIRERLLARRTARQL